MTTLRRTKAKQVVSRSDVIVDVIIGRCADVTVAMVMRRGWMMVEVELVMGQVGHTAAR